MTSVFLKGSESALVKPESNAIGLDSAVVQGIIYPIAQKPSECSAFTKC